MNRTAQIRPPAGQTSWAETLLVGQWKATRRDATTLVGSRTPAVSRCALRVVQLVDRALVMRTGRGAVDGAMERQVTAATRALWRACGSADAHRRYHQRQVKAGRSKRGRRMAHLLFVEEVIRELPRCGKIVTMKSVTRALVDKKFTDADFDERVTDELNRCTEGDHAAGNRIKIWVDLVSESRGGRSEKMLSFSWTTRMGDYGRHMSLKRLENLIRELK